MELASRVRRLAAQLIDAALLCGLVFASTLDGVLPQPVLVLFVCAAFALALFQLVLLARRGQTLGKIAVGVRIVRLDTGENGGFLTNVLLRSLVNSLLSTNPLYLLIDSCFIFRSERRCLHDLIAGTIVVPVDVDSAARDASSD
jgi:uncharacterized RDD family membrane protein YckC